MKSKLLVLLGALFLVSFGLEAACGTEPVVVPVNVDTDYANNTESAPQSIVGGALHGFSGFSTNYECVGDRCYCDEQMSDDCDRLISSGLCKNGTYGCPIGPGSSACDCELTPPSMPTGCGDDPNCQLANVYVGGGIYQISGNPALYYRWSNNDRACYITGIEWTLLGNPAPTVLTNWRAVFLQNAYSGQTCTTEEIGIVPFGGAKPNGYYQTPDTIVHKKIRGRSCMLTSAQFQALGSPPRTQISTSTLGTFNSGQWCKDMEFMASMN